jgi:BRCT domain type II-containing protein
MARNGKKSHAFASKAKPKAKKPTVAKNRNEMDTLTAELDASLNTTTFHGWTRLLDEVSIRKAIQGGVFLESPPK